MTSPLELLTDRDSRQNSFLNDIWCPAAFGGLAFLGVCFLNFATRRPLLSGIQKHVVFTLGGAATGKVVDDWRNEFLATRDATLRHYIELHPEDFPTPDRKKFGEIMQRWIPIR